MDRYLSIPEAMAVLGVKSRNTIKRYILEGHLDATRLPSPGGRGPWRVSENSIHSLLESKVMAKARELIAKMNA